jgi:hypothetical protein
MVIIEAELYSMIISLDKDVNEMVVSKSQYNEYLRFLKGFKLEGKEDGFIGNGKLYCNGIELILN